MGKRAKSKRKTGWRSGISYERPTTGVYQPPNIRKAFFLRKYVQVAAYGFLPLLLVVVTLLAGLPAEIAKVTSKPEQEVSLTAEVQGRSVAISKVQEWLSSDIPPLPGARFISWDRYELIKPLTQGSTKREREDIASQKNYLHFMTIADPAGNLYTATVPVIGSSGSVKANGEPSLTPQRPMGGSAALKTWPGMTPINAPQGLESAVKAWAVAFTSGDPGALKQVTGDGKAGRVYLPLAKVKTLKKVDMGEVAPARGYSSRDKDGNRVIPSRVIVRVSLAVIWEGMDTTRSVNLPTFEMDLLADRANTASPVIVAWGGAGTGPILTKYQNGEEGIDDTEATPDKIEEEKKPKYFDQLGKEINEKGERVEDADAEEN